MNIKRIIAIAVLDVLAFAIILSIWQYIYSANLVPHSLLSSPRQVAFHFLKIISGQIVVKQLIFTMEVIVFAFIATLLVGTAIGLFVGEMSYLKQVLEPYLILMNSIPRVMFIVLFWALVGFGFGYEFWFAFISGLFPVIINTVYAVGTVEPTHIRLAKSLGAGNLQVQTKVMLPTVFPSILSASRLSFNLTLGGVIIAEEFTGSLGLGHLAAFYAENIEPVNLYSVVLLVSLISISINIFLLQLEKYLTRWNAART